MKLKKESKKADETLLALKHRIKTDENELKLLVNTVKNVKR